MTREDWDKILTEKLSPIPWNKKEYLPTLERMVLADWLEEQGSEESEFQRWLALNKKSPSLGYYQGNGDDLSWAWSGTKDESFDCLPDELHKLLKAKKERFDWCHYNTREEAEADLYQAWLQWRKENAE